jgi:hypothetical protein
MSLGALGEIVGSNCGLRGPKVKTSIYSRAIIAAMEDAAEKRCSTKS